MAQGTHAVEISMEGGSGKAFIHSPVEVSVQDGSMKARLVWNSVNYDYMVLDGVRYDNENAGGESTFTVPVKSLDEPMTFLADTVAMSKPHEIEYTIHWLYQGDTDPKASREEETNRTGDAQPFANEAEYDTLKLTGTLDLQYAEQFTVTRYEGCQLIRIASYGDYLLIDEGAEVPAGLPENVTILKRPLDTTYLVSSSAMDFVCRLDCLDHIRLTGTREEDWSLEQAASAMRAGRILYAGKYRAPDYELLLDENCDLAIENTMIEHDPAVKEKLKELGIPVLIETSSYESHPLGRLEWIKLYGVLFDKEAEAERYFNEQLQRMKPVMEQDPTGLRVAFFHVTSAGQINVRKPGDYISEMIRLSGGTYVIPEGTGQSDTMLSSMNIQMEDFYRAARDADILIYNSTIAGEIASVSELTEKNALFADFKAVREKRVYCTERDFFQQATGMADFMEDLHKIYTGEDDDLVYLFCLP